MAAPDYYATQTELEIALGGRTAGAKKLRQLFPGEGSSTTADAAGVALVLNTATGETRSYVQNVLQLASLDDLWETTWTEKDRSEIRRITLVCAVYWAHHFGEGGEDVPETAVRSYERAREDLKGLAERLRAVGANAQPASNRQHEFIAPRQVGDSPVGGPRAHFGRTGGFC